MKTAVVTLESISPYSQSRPMDAPHLEKESPKDYEARCWRNRLHVDEKGQVFIPPMTFKNCLSEIAKYLGQKIQGKGQATYTKHFEAGVLVVDGLVLPLKPDEVEGEWLFLNSDGKRGGGKRVWKCYPKIPKWSGEVRFLIVDETITNSVFEQHIREAGNYIGIGRFRPRNNGYYGRFTVKKIVWE